VTVKVGDRIRAGKLSRYAATDYGHSTQIDADGTVFGTFDDGSPFIQEKRMVRDLEPVDG